MKFSLYLVLPNKKDLNLNQSKFYLLKPFLQAIKRKIQTTAHTPVVAS